ncbi:hypothetical protein LTR84_007131 [Exophiala bonariae]|uniref:Metallo-beta-lactamase domain-containing protein n=1 Tax=Exophiala bonariae TaxID=1690606 RepID=A0AAV9N1U4_9EURO|nr:hypothetical protein LTR84_007131 [Exophiala bonariae]
MPFDGYLTTPKAAPALDVPLSSTSVQVRVIDTTSRLSAPASMILEPAIPGHDTLHCPAYSFLIEHPSGRRLLYDLGTRRDWQMLSPMVQGLLKQHDLHIEVEKNVAEILEEGGVAVSNGAIEALIWSHWHYDHIGDPSTFPASTALIVGPGFKQAFLPGYPEGSSSVILQSDYEGRELRELIFEPSAARIGGLQYHDHFGDGSFYILNAPGHAIGHLCALARVSTGEHGQQGQDSFIFMGGDTCHHGGEFRPTEYLPLPKTLDPSPMSGARMSVCPGAWLQEIHHEKKSNEPFYRVKQGFSYHAEDCERTIAKMSEFDAADNVLVIIAHDTSLLEEGFPMFPDFANDWLSNDFARKLRWCFVKDFQKAIEGTRNV